jgi:hypothetical protein
MTLVEAIAEWQQEALSIQPPPGTGHLPAIGGLPGPAFFPEGYGLSHPIRPENARPTVMAIGHNFGCEIYRQEIGPAGREDDKATWRNLDRILRDAGCSPDQCFRTNWFVGLLPGDKQVGRFLLRSDPKYEQACRSLLFKQIQFFRPAVILLLGPEVASRAYQIIPALVPWRDAGRWTDIDRSSIGHSPRNVEVPAANLRTNVAALLHPSFGAANQRRRMKNMVEPATEAEIIRGALKS